MQSQSIQRVQDALNDFIRWGGLGSLAALTRHSDSASQPCAQVRGQRLPRHMLCKPWNLR